jgi:hypothetical protein
MRLVVLVDFRLGRLLMCKGVGIFLSKAFFANECDYVSLPLSAA